MTIQAETDTIMGQLRAIRTQRGVTMRQVADALHVTPQAVSFWELGRNNVPLATVLAYCDFLGVHLRLDTGDP